MNYLELCQEANSEAGFQGTITSVSATGYQSRVMYAVMKAWLDIQKLHKDWNFLRTHTTFDTEVGTQLYTTSAIGISDHSEWIKKSVLYNYRPLREYDYDYYITLDLSSNQAGVPYSYSINPSDHSLIIWPVSGAYEIDAHYYRSPQVLSDTTDVPIFNAEHHRLIVNRAVLRLTAFINNPVVFGQHREEYREGLIALKRKELPAKTIKQRPIA